MFLYGLRARPIGADMEVGKKAKSFVEHPTEEEKSKWGFNVRFGYISTLEELSSDFVQNHELVDLSVDEQWEKCVSVMQYIIKKDRYELFLSKQFYQQIGMNEDEFLNLCNKHGFDCEDEAYVFSAEQ